MQQRQGIDFKKYLKNPREIPMGKLFFSCRQLSLVFVVITVVF